MVIDDKIDLKKIKLRLKYIIIKNFKSYYGENIIGPFFDGINAIIGPNGSGKSNIIDAILFVLGYFSTKLRQPNISSLIYDSNNQEELKYCSVTLQFDDNFTLQRKGYKNSRSDYFINGQKATYAEVLKNIIEREINPKRNRFLILQGEVELIPQMKPKISPSGEPGMLEFLEEIIGTSHFIELIEEMENLISQKIAESSLFEKTLNVSQKEIQEFDKYYKNAIETLRNVNLISEKKASIYQKIIWKFCNRLEKLQKKIINFEQRETEITTFLEKLKADNLLETDKLRCLNDKYKISEDELKNYLNILESLDLDLNNESNILNKFESLLENFKQKHKKKTKIKSEKSQNLLKLEQNHIKFQEVNSKLDNESKIMEKKIDMHRVKINSIKNINDQELLNLYSEKSKLENFIQKSKIQENMFQEYEKTKEKLDLEFQSLLDQKKNVCEYIEKCKKDLIDQKNQIKDLMADELKIEKEKDIIKLDYNEIQKNLLEMQKKIKKFDDLNNKLNSSEIAYLRIKESKINGIYGRLKNLGNIDSKYDIAVNAATKSLNHIVVKSAEIAERLIKILREEKLGKLTFIILDKLKLPIETNFNEKKLYKLIKCDQKFIPAFYFAFGETLIAETLEEAKKLAYGTIRNRVVTINGELIELGGSMTLGSNPNDRKNYSRISTIKENNLEILNYSNLQIRNEIEKVSNQLIELEKEMMKKYKEINDLKKLINKIEREKDICNNNLKKYEVEYEIVLKNIDYLNSKKEVLKHEKIEINLKELEKFKEKHKEVEYKISKIENQKLDQDYLNFKKESAKLEKINQEIEKNMVELELLSKEIMNEKRKVNSEQMEIEDLKKKCEETEKNIKESKEKIQSLYEKKQKIIEKIKIVEKKEIELRNESENLKNEIFKTEENIKKLNNEKEIIIEEINNANLDVQNYQKQIENYQTSLESLKFYINPETEEIPKLSIELITQIDRKADEKESSKVLIDRLKELEKEEKEFLDIPFMNIIEKYKELNGLYTKKKEKYNNLIEEQNKIKEEYEKKKMERYTTFISEFERISNNVREIYQKLTSGGSAELELVDSLDPFSGGVIFTAMPPKKTWKPISHLSGGEKTIASLALIFALHNYKPTPIYIMDEIDAALDSQNIKKISTYIKNDIAKSAQFIIVSLREDMFSCADFLLGVYKRQESTQTINYVPQTY